MSSRIQRVVDRLLPTRDAECSFRGAKGCCSLGKQTPSMSGKEIKALQEAAKVAQLHGNTKLAAELKQTLSAGA